MKDFLIIAHRGASGYAPENTLAAFAKAVELGAVSVEFDVQKTRDGELVVIHDTNLARLGGLRKSVGKLAWKDLSTLDVGAWFDSKFRGQTVPTLVDTLDALEEGRKDVEIQLEIKHGLRPYRGIERRVVDLLRSWPGGYGKVVLSSFRHKTLWKVRELLPDARLGYLAGATRLKAAVREASRLGCESVHQSHRRVNRAWVDAVHAAGMKLLVYTVNTKKDLEQIRALGVDGVFSNFPDIDESVPKEAVLRRPGEDSRLSGESRNPDNNLPSGPRLAPGRRSAAPERR